LTKYCDYGTLTIVMTHSVPKAKFKSKVLAYLREVEKKKQPLIITHAGQPVVSVVPYKEKTLLETLHNTVLSYENPTEPAGVDWEAQK